MSGMEINSVAVVFVAVGVLTLLTFLVWRSVERLMTASKDERGPVSDRGPRTERGLRDALTDASASR